MNLEHSLNRTKITMRRLFKYDAETITECFKNYSQLFFSPFTPQFISDIFLYGEFWGAFAQDTLIACSYIYPFDCELSRNEKRYEQLCDFVDTPAEYMIMGYIGFNPEIFSENNNYSDENSVHSCLYQAFLNIAEMQTFRRGLKHVLHCAPLKTVCDVSPFFKCGYRLIKLRGLENLVVHYIFAKDVYNPEKQKGENLHVALGNTKVLSRFLESGYYAFDIVDGSILLVKNQ